MMKTLDERVKELLARLRTTHFAGRDSARAAVRRLTRENPCSLDQVTALMAELNRRFPTPSTLAMAKAKQTPSDAALTIRNTRVLIGAKHWESERAAHAYVADMQRNGYLDSKFARILHMEVRRRYAPEPTKATEVPTEHPLQASESMRGLEEHVRLKMETQRYELVRMVAPMVVQAAGRRSAATKEKMYPAASLAKFSLAIVDSIIEGLYRKE